MSSSNNTKQNLQPKLRFPEFRDAGGWLIDHGDKFFSQISNKNHNSDLPILAITQEHGAIPRDEINYRVSVTDKSIESYKIVEMGDFIISLRSFQGGIEYSNYKGLCSPAYVILRKKSTGNSGFFKHYFKSDRFIKDLNKDIEGLRDGKMVSYSQFSDLLLPVPTTFEEQKRIADCLSSLDDVIAAEGQKLETLRQHKKGLMQELFPAEGETLPKLRFPEFRDAGGWEEKPLWKICDVLQGYGFPEVLQGGCSGKYPFCKVSDISKAVADKGGDLDMAANYIGDDELLKLRAKLIPIGATVFAKIGEALRLNRRALVKKECLIDNNAIGLKAIRGIAEDYFVYLLSQKIDLNEHCGGAVPSVNKSTLQEIMVTVPNNPKEQKRIADCLSSLDTLITAQSQKLETLRQHKKGLMQQLFPSPEDVEA